LRMVLFRVAVTEFADIGGFICSAFPAIPGFLAIVAVRPESSPP